VGLREWLGLDAPAQAPAEFSGPWSVSDPELAAIMAGWIGLSNTGLPSVSEADAFGIPAFSRGVELIAGTIASLPLKAYVKDGDGQRTEVPSVLDRPQGPFGISKFQWVEMVMLHLAVYREAFLLHQYNGAGVLSGFWPVHPSAVNKVSWSGPRKVFEIHDANGQTTTYGDAELTHIMGPNAYGLRGVPLYTSHRKVFQTAIAGEQAAARSFTAPLIRGIVTTAPDEDVDGDEAKLIQEKLNARIGGTDNAGQFAMVNRHLVFTPWSQTNADAQFMESRAYENEEFARMLGLPPHLLALIEKQTSWGTGVAEQNIGLARYCLMGYTSRFESAIEAVLPDGVFAEFDYKGLLQGSPADEIGLLIDQKSAGVLSVEEVRAKLNQPGPAPVPAAPTGVPPNG
jgi:HK97 family phage portal protein